MFSGIYSSLPFIAFLVIGIALLIWYASTLANVDTAECNTEVPSNLTAISIGDTIKLSWDSVDASSYTIYVKSEGNPTMLDYDEKIVHASNAFFYVPSDEVRMCFAVSATHGNCETELSNVACIEGDCDLPIAPVATHAPGNCVDWAAVPDAISYVIYMIDDIFVTPSKDTHDRMAAVPASTTTFCHPGAGRISYTVAAVSACGEGPISNVVSFRG